MTEPLSESTRLQMYTYYGSVSWEILGIFLAAGLIIAILPITAKEAIWKLDSIVRFGYILLNEIVAFFTAFFGALLWNRNQALAHSWVHSPTDQDYRQSLEAWVDWYERKRNKWKCEKPQEQVGGIVYAIILMVLALAYILVTGIILLVML